MKKKSVLLAIVIASMMSSTTGCSDESDKPIADEVQGGDVTLFEDSLLTEEENDVQKSDKSDAPLPRGDWDFDVENGALFVDEDGNIVDRDGNPVETYSNIQRVEGSNGLMDTEDNTVMNGYSVDGDKVILDIPSEVEYNENPGSDAAQQAPESYTDVTIEDLNYDPNGYDGMAVQCSGEVWYSDAEGFTLVPIDWDTSGDLSSVYVPGNFSPVPQEEDFVFVQGIFTVDEYGNRNIDAYYVEIQ